MTITAAGLYGPQDPAASPDSTSWQTARFVIPRATTPAAPLSVPFVARSVQVDNASGSWYLVNGRRVPPWTVSAVVALDLPSSQISVAAATPGGQLPEAAGEDLLLVVTDQPLAPFPGIYTPPVRAFTAQFARLPLIAELPAAAVPQVVVAAALPIVLTRLAFTWDLRDLGGPVGAGYDPRAIVTCLWEEVPPPPAPAQPFSWQQAISPEDPYTADVLEQGAVVIAAGSALTAAAIVQLSGSEIVLGVSATQTIALAQYYELEQ